MKRFVNILLPAITMAALTACVCAPVFSVPDPLGGIEQAIGQGNASAGFQVSELFQWPIRDQTYPMDNRRLFGSYSLFKSESFEMNLRRENSQSYFGVAPRAPWYYADASLSLGGTLRFTDQIILDFSIDRSFPDKDQFPKILGKKIPKMFQVYKGSITCQFNEHWGAYLGYRSPAEKRNPTIQYANRGMALRFYYNY
ncbi:hypothetical protein EDC14_10483 [Hydrogenispora ethanolica]|uniref:Lipoprotein n=1 Tax=Hydrogenispora ethanolica TaxID=1082276 RepID=A0A4R1QY50_HYDET|nr:hypothetical protein [Hydrogenispora ethanolica]TCL56790.1 hypothetical protein EDC14_10483 [Hydrogenispora ethanolica]